MPDFTAHRHPVMAVPCPDCRAVPSTWCRRPRGYCAAALHAERRMSADRSFVAAYGPLAEIWRDTDPGRGEIEGADARVEALA